MEFEFMGAHEPLSVNVYVIGSRAAFTHFRGGNAKGEPGIGAVAGGRTAELAEA